MKTATSQKENADEILYDEPQEDEKNGSYLLKSLLSLTAGFAFACFDEGKELSPFSVAFLSAVPYGQCLGAFIGSCIGYLITYPLTEAIKYTVAMTLLILFRFILLKIKGSEDGSILTAAAAFFCLLLSGIAHLFYVGFSAVSAIYLSAESLAALACSYFFSVAFGTKLHKRSIYSLCRRDIFCLAVSLCTFLMCVSSITIEGVSPGRIFACLVLMFTALYKGVTYSSVAGILIGTSLCLTPDGNHLFPCFVLGGFFSGVFASSGQVATAISFTLVYLFSAFFAADTSEMWVCFVEPCVAFACFIIIPRSKINSFQDFIGKSTLQKDAPVSPAVSGKIKRASESLYSVAQTVSSVSEKLDTVINPEVNRLFSSLQQKVCYGCERKQNCWKKNFDTTASDILSVAGIENRKGGKLSLAVNCRRYEDMCMAISSCYPAYASALTAKSRIKEMRQLLTDQFTGMGDYLCKLSESAAESRTKDSAKSAYIKTALNEGGVFPDTADCFTESGRVRAELYFMDIPKDSTVRKAKKILEKITNRRFLDADIETTELFIRLDFEEKPLYKISTGFSQHPVKADKPCGDSFSFFLSGETFPVALISDGMGTGSRAAMDSNVTVSVLSQLVSCGFSFPLAIRIVNSALIMKSTDESTSTVDAVEINTFSGAAYFYKAGAAASFIRQGDEVTVIEKVSMPLGILKDTAVSVSQKKLMRGDIVLLVSDGVTNGDCAWINDELLAWSTNNMNDLAGHIASLARLRNLQSTGDDITVLALKVENNK